MGTLRFLLAVSVVLAHSSSIFGNSLVGGQIAVQSFYMISGFYMALILTEKYIGANSSYKLFITNRLLRLYPIYWVVLALTILFSVFMFFHSNGLAAGKLDFYLEYWKSLDFPELLFMLLTNIIILFQDIVLFLGFDVSEHSFFFTSNFRSTSPMLFNGLFVHQAWTISIEIAFYLIAPFIVRKPIWYLILLAVLSLALRTILISNGYSNDPWTYRFFPTEMLFFTIGIIGYHVYQRFEHVMYKKAVPYTAFVILILLTLLYGYVDFQWKAVWYLALFGMAIPFIFNLSKSWKIDRYIGELSYPIYISHLFLLMVMNYLELPTFGGKGINLVILTVILSVILNEMVSKRIDAYRAKRLALK